MDTEWVRDTQPTVDDDDTSKLFQAYSDKQPELRFVTQEMQEFKALKAEVQAITGILKVHPYHPLHWLDRSRNLLRLHYPELALGDAYKSWLLLRECQETESDLGQRARSEVAAAHSELSDELKNEDDLLRIIHVLEAEAFYAICQALFFANCFADCSEALSPIKMRYANNAEHDILRQFVTEAIIDERAYHRNQELPEPLTEAQIQEKLAQGSIRPQIYPWMSQHITERSKGVKERMVHELEFMSDFSCSLRKSDTISASEQSNIAGIFATVDLNEGEVLFSEKASIAVVSDGESRCGLCLCLLSVKDNITFQNPCCTSLYCSPGCMRRGNRLLHLCNRPNNELGSLDNEDIKSNTKSETSRLKKKGRKPKYQPPTPYIAPAAHIPESLKIPFETFSQSCRLKPEDSLQRQLMQRLLIACIHQLQESSKDPLENSLVNGICAFYPSELAVDFNFTQDILEPLDTLHQSGVDIFACHQLDTWVLQVIWARVRTNSWQHEDLTAPKGRPAKVKKRAMGSAQWQGISPMLSLFNHSCDPNVTWNKDKHDASLEVKTLRPVKAGEELCWSYRENEVLELDLPERTVELSQWFDDCKCKRCGDERAELPQVKGEDLHFEKKHLLEKPVAPRRSNVDIIATDSISVDAAAPKTPRRVGVSSHFSADDKSNYLPTPTSEFRRSSVLSPELPGVEGDTLPARPEHLHSTLASEDLIPLSVSQEVNVLPTGTKRTSERSDAAKSTLIFGDEIPQPKRLRLLVSSAPNVQSDHSASKDHNGPPKNDDGSSAVSSSIRTDYITDGNPIISTFSRSQQVADASLVGSKALSGPQSVMETRTTSHNLNMPLNSHVPSSLADQTIAGLPSKESAYVDAYARRATQPTIRYHTDFSRCMAKWCHKVHISH